MTNIVTAVFKEGDVIVRTKRKLFRYDYGQVLVFEGLELPSAFEVHFANSPDSATAERYVGTNGQIQIPNKFVESGEFIYAWVFVHVGEDDGETVKGVVIRVDNRPQATDPEEPTPEEESAIEEAIRALQLALAEAEETVSHYPKIENGTWHVWDVETGEYVDTGVNATGPVGATGATGARGATGTRGATGPQGVSPTIKITEISNGHRVTVTDAIRTSYFNVMNGATGPRGPQGDSYVLTQEDKIEIAEIVKSML